MNPPPGAEWPSDRQAIRHTMGPKPDDPVVAILADLTHPGGSGAPATSDPQNRTEPGSDPAAQVTGGIPADLRGLAETLRAVTGPGTPEELRHEESVVTALTSSRTRRAAGAVLVGDGASADGASPLVPNPDHGNERARVRRLSTPLKAAVVGVAAAALIGGAAAAATGVLPVPGFSDRGSDNPVTTDTTGTHSSGTDRSDTDRSGSRSDGSERHDTSAEDPTAGGTEEEPVETTTTVPVQATNPASSPTTAQNPSPGSNGAAHGSSPNAGGNPSPRS